MVMFSEWKRMALDPGIPSDLPMNGESADFGVSAPDPAGYLGKVNERASLVENCPWCSAKGQIYGLRSYRINFHESVTLCTNPECLFPLVSKPLEEILSSLTTGDCEDAGKRKDLSGEDAYACSEDPEVADGLASDVGLSRSGGMSHQVVTPDKNGEPTEAAAHLHTDLGTRDPECGPRCGDLLPRDADGGPDVDYEEPDNPLGDAGETGSENEIVPSMVEEVMSSTEQVVLLPKGEVVTGASKEQEPLPMAEQEVRLSEKLKWVPVRPLVEPEARPQEEHEGRLPQEPAARLVEEEGEFPMEAQEVVEPEAIPEDQMAVELQVGPTVEEEVRPMVEQKNGPAEMVAAPSHLFWKNENNLCWLDALLVALVHCRTLKKRAASLLKNTSPIQKLCSSYNKACDVMKAEEQMCHEDKTVKVPSAVLDQTLKELEDLRASTFSLLQPKLRITLGQKETPVFALPVLLSRDPSAEALFQHMFHWDFECTVCGHTSRSRCTKTLSTFPGVFPDWHPLRMAHPAQCNSCERRHQRREMSLKSISPVFALHFVEGLPQNNVDAYAFDFQDHHYFVSTVIQYDRQLRHFVSWIRDDSGSWLEFDDLKYPQCISHKRLPVPAKEIHLLFWEDQAVMQEGACPRGGCQSDTPMDTGSGSGDTHQRDLSLTFPQDDTYIMEALSEEGKASPHQPDSSVGSTTLLDAFEGLSHSDIITLTLVEVKVDADGHTQADEGLPVTAETSPISSTRAAEGKGHRTPKQQKGAKGARKAPGGNTVAQPDGGGLVLPLVSSPPASKSLSPIPSRPSPVSGPPSPVSDPPSPVSKPPSPSTFPAARMSAVLSRHPSFQSTPAPTKRISSALSYKPTLTLVNDGLHDQPAKMFRGFGSLDETPRTENRAFKQPTCPQPRASPLGDTSALRRKLLRKLKKKKKLLAALDSMMGKGTLKTLQRPDSIESNSPYTVSSTTSQCSSSSYNELLNDLISPSNQSPDSTGLLEMLVTGQEGKEPESKTPTVLPGAGRTDWDVPATAGNDPSSAKDDFMEEFMSGSGFQAANTENVDFNMFDMFFN